MEFLFSRQHCFFDSFKKNSDVMQIKIIGNYKDVTAFHCNECRVTVIGKYCLKCPECNNEMENGMAYVRRTKFFGIFSFRSAPEHCFFDSPRNFKPLKIIDNSENLTAFYCKECGVAVISPNYQLVCPYCSEEIKSFDYECRNCRKYVANEKKFIKIENNKN